MPIIIERLWSCNAPATISEAEAEEELIKTTKGTSVSNGLLAAIYDFSHDFIFLKFCQGHANISQVPIRSGLIHLWPYFSETSIKSLSHDNRIAVF